MYSSLSLVLLLHIPQMPRSRGLTLISVLLSLTGGEWRGALVCLVMEACKDGLLEQGLLSC
jgi:hypothetical protein